MTETSAAWSTYWESANLHSCLASGGGDDQRLLELQWQAFAVQLPCGAKVLDLATGNGAVPHSLLTYNDELNVSAVDYSDIQPHKLFTQTPVLKRVSFYPNTDITRLPNSKIPAQSFDALTSQFGIEYAGLQRVLERCLGLVREGGRVKFIVHHAHSELLASSRRKLSELTHLLSTEGLVRKVVMWSNGKLNYEELERAGKNNVDHCPHRSRAISGQVFDGINQIINLAESDPARGILLAESMQKRMNAEKQRLHQLDAAAITEDEIIALELLFTEAGFGKIKTNTIELEPQGYLLAWNFEAEKQ